MPCAARHYLLDGLHGEPGRGGTGAGQRVAPVRHVPGERTALTSKN